MFSFVNIQSYLMQSTYSIKSQTNHSSFIITVDASLIFEFTHACTEFYSNASTIGGKLCVAVAKRILPVYP